MDDNTDDTSTDELDARIAALQAETVTETEPEATTEPVEAVAEAETTAKEEPAEEASETEEDEHQKRLDRLYFESREAKREAKRLAAENEVLKGTRTETRDETIQREAATMASQIAQQNKFNEECNRIGKAMDKTYGSAQAIVATFQEAFPDQNGIPMPILAAVIEAGEGQEHKVLQYLSKNLDIAEQIMTKSPTQQGVAIAKIAAKLSQPVVSKAPPPIRPVAGAASNGGEAPQKSFDKMSKAEQILFFDNEDQKERLRKYSH